MTVFLQYNIYYSINENNIYIFKKKIKFLFILIIKNDLF